MLKKLLILVILAAPTSILAQAIDNTMSYKNINSNSYFRISYENDFFSSTDIYYTQGVSLELVSPAMEKFPLSKLLWYPGYAYVRYGVGMEQDGYTPTSLGSDGILYGDRPFAACLYLKTFSIAIDSVKKQRFSTTLSTGVIGPGAGGMETQTNIHKWLHDITPHGWDNQIQNDAILNYEVEYEKSLFSFGRVFSMDAFGMARAGTLSDKAGAGVTLQSGYFDLPYSSFVNTKRNFRIYAYEHPEVDVVGYDATLEGGIFDKKSLYAIPSKDISRFTFQNRFGFVVIYHRFYLEYFQSLLSQEFKTGTYHVWGGVQVAFGL